MHAFLLCLSLQFACSFLLSYDCQRKRINYSHVTYFIRCDWSHAAGNWVYGIDQAASSAKIKSHLGRVKTVFRILCKLGLSHVSYSTHSNDYYVYLSSNRIPVVAVHVWTMAPVKLDTPVKAFVVFVAQDFIQQIAVKVLYVEWRNIQEPITLVYSDNLRICTSGKL